jgi:hypothetical protein
MSYPAPIRMKREYTFNVKALEDSMTIDGRGRILGSEDMQKALGHFKEGTYPNRAAYSAAQAINNLCRENDVPVYSRGVLLDEAERYKDACIVEGGEVYPNMNILITWLAQHYSRDTTLRRHGETHAMAYKRIRAGMKRKFSKNSSYQKEKLIGDYESIIGERMARENEIVSEPGPVNDDRVVKRRLPKKAIQLSFLF